MQEHIEKQKDQQTQQQQHKEQKRRTRNINIKADLRTCLSRKPTNNKNANQNDVELAQRMWIVVNVTCFACDTEVWTEDRNCKNTVRVHRTYDMFCVFNLLYGLLFIMFF